MRSEIFEMQARQRDGSAVGLAYESIRDRIISLALPPGAPLNETELANQLGVGLTPVRDSIKRLALEHLIVVYPRRGTFVSEINLADERWLTEARVEMEGLAAELAASRGNLEERRAIMSCVEKLLAESHPLRINAIDTEFHRLVYRAAHNPFLEASLNQYLNLSVRLWYYCRDRLRAKSSDGDFHKQVADAIMAGDAQGARAGIVAHLRQSSADLREVM
ncbi:GntR family transcriptional regulator [Pararhizobium sp. YC-54]|uniref:GntR family transcriptional regulator n=1 Tax=Pararhizobium sp. YC-54 TaxID=2986920 RepID=UPI0021F705B0|nr:GntR family transcriptional regulator [Pararhizobium sp. YC-54]MCW0001061.1 GntR family transcriptional regulator [Pararhizobium sp. YC-54]